MILFYPNDHKHTSKDLTFFKEISLAIYQIKQSENESVYFGYYHDIYNSKLEDKYGLTTEILPKVLFFNNQKDIVFTGSTKAQPIKAWIKRQLRDKSKHISHEVFNSDQMKDVTQSVDLYAMYFGDLKSQNYQIYLEAMREYPSAQFYHTKDFHLVKTQLNSINDNYNVEDQMSREDVFKSDVAFFVNSALITDFAGVQYYKPKNGIFKKDQIIYNLNRMKNDQTKKISVLRLDRIYYHNINMYNYIWLIDRDFSVYEGYYEQFCKKHRKAITCYYMDKDLPETRFLWEHNMNIKLTGSPKVFMYQFDRSGEDAYKYEQKDISGEHDQENWYKHILNGDWPEYISSEDQPIIEDDEGLEDYSFYGLEPPVELIQRIYGKNYQEVVNDNKYDVIVYVHGSNSLADCEYCTIFEPAYEEAAEIINRDYSNIPIKLTKINKLKNDLPGHHFETLPKWFMYLRNQKENPIELQLGTNSKQIIEFLKEHVPSWSGSNVPEDL